MFQYVKVLFISQKTLLLTKATMAFAVVGLEMSSGVKPRSLPISRTTDQMINAYSLYAQNSDVKGHIPQSMVFINLIPRRDGQYPERQWTWRFIVRNIA